MYLLSANGTLRTILLLLIAWQLLRLWMNLQKARQPGAGNRWTNEPPRPKGEVRIERVEEVGQSPAPTNVEDADYEVIKDEPNDR